MAIIQQRERELRFAKHYNLAEEANVQGNYIHDMIHAFGVDVLYYKLKTPYPDVFKPILDNNRLCMSAYGYDSTPEWHLAVPLITYIKYETDELLLNKFGMQPNITATCWIDATDFAIAYASKLATYKEYKAIGNEPIGVEFENQGDFINNCRKLLLGFNTQIFNGICKPIFTEDKIKTLMDESNWRKEINVEIPCNVEQHGDLLINVGRINPDLWKGLDYNRFVDRTFESYLKFVITRVDTRKNGEILITGHIEGAVIYYDLTVINRYVQNIKPDVGDVIAINTYGFVDGGYDRFEIVHCEDTNIHETYQNVFTRKYCYELNLRTYIEHSAENPMEHAQVEENRDKLKLINTSAAEDARKLSIYENKEDSVYGGYQKVNTVENSIVVPGSMESNVLIEGGTKPDNADFGNNKIITYPDFGPEFKPKSEFDDVMDKLLGREKDSSLNLSGNSDSNSSGKKLDVKTFNIFRFEQTKIVVQVIEDNIKNTLSLNLVFDEDYKLTIDTHFQYFLKATDTTLILIRGDRIYRLASLLEKCELDDNKIIKPRKVIRKVYQQKGGYLDQPFYVSTEDPIEMEMNLMNLTGGRPYETELEEINNPGGNIIKFSNTHSYLDIKMLQDKQTGKVNYELRAHFAKDVKKRYKFVLARISKD